MTVYIVHHGDTWAMSYVDGIYLTMAQAWKRKNWLDEHQPSTRKREVTAKRMRRPRP